MYTKLKYLLHVNSSYKFYILVKPMRKINTENLNPRVQLSHRIHKINHICRYVGSYTYIGLCRERESFGRKVVYLRILSISYHANVLLVVFLLRRFEIY